jgi:hypothetical protein
MPTVTRGRCLLLAILVYVTLDLALPAMPGAFVFEAADSVESAQTHRGRIAGDAVTLAPPRPPAMSPELDDADAPTVPAHTRPTSHEVVSRVPRASLTAPRPSEDPQ